MKRLIISYIVLFLLGYTGLFAQYHLTEIGLKFGGGTHQPFGYDGVKTNVGYNADVFCTKYVCGKSYGWWLELGYRGFHVKETTVNTPSLVVPMPIGKLGLQLSNLHLGAYFKIRKNNYHRPKETALLIGPFLRYSLFYLSNIERDSVADGFLSSDDYKTLTDFTYGPHLSVFLRRPRGNKKSWYIHFGAEYSINKAMETRTGLGFNSLYGFLNIGFQLWNNL